MEARLDMCSFYAWVEGDCSISLRLAFSAAIHISFLRAQADTQLLHSKAFTLCDTGSQLIDYL